MAGAPPPLQPPLATSSRTGTQLAPPPPLLPGWTEHIGPQGQMYWHNAQIGISQYDRPSAMPIYSGPPPSHSIQSETQPTASSQTNGTLDKEKPAKKEEIPGAQGWLRITTNKSNIFYTHRASKRSEWSVPDEIRAQVDAMEKEEQRAKQAQAEAEREEKRRIEEERKTLQRQAEAEQRRKSEEERAKVQRERLKRQEALRKQQEDQARIQSERLRVLQDASKRKRESEQQDQAELHDKKQRIEQEEGLYEQDEDDWQRQMAAEMAEEAEAQDAQAQSTVVDSTAQTVELSLDECKEVFMLMLSSLNGSKDEINPMMPWDRELPKFVNHRDYSVLSNLRDRQDAFNEWCKIRIRERRKAPSTSAALKASENRPSATPAEEVEEGEVKGKGSDSDDALATYRTLLVHEVTSTRARWEDFRKTWKRDRRFFTFGRDDRDREKVFRSWQRELGEKKRKAAEQAEIDFVALLDEKLDKKSFSVPPSCSKEDVQSMWSRAKRTPDLDKDARYDAVGSSTRRSELFDEWARGKRQAKGGAYMAAMSTDASLQPLNDKGTERRRGDAQSALREREEQVRLQKRQMEVHNAQSLGHAVHDASLLGFQQLLVDAVRDPLATLEETFQDLSQDERFTAPGLHEREKRDAFNAHVDKLNERRLRALEQVFARHAPTLNIDAEEAIPLVRNDDEIVLKGLTLLRDLANGEKTLGELFDEWSEKRERQAQGAFEQMLKENAFVEFWGRLRQEYVQKQRQGGQEEDLIGNDEASEDEEDVPSMLRMAAKMDLGEVHAVLRNDARYRAFQHKPDLREEWIRDYLANMQIPKQTVHQRE